MKIKDALWLTVLRDWVDNTSDTVLVPMPLICRVVSIHVHAWAVLHSVVEMAKKLVSVEKQDYGFALKWISIVVHIWNILLHSGPLQGTLADAAEHALKFCAVSTIQFQCWHTSFKEFFHTPTLMEYSNEPLVALYENASSVLAIQRQLAIIRVASRIQLVTHTIAEVFMKKTGQGNATGPSERTMAVKHGTSELAPILILTVSFHKPANMTSSLHVPMHELTNVDKWFGALRDREAKFHHLGQNPSAMHLTFLPLTPVHTLVGPFKHPITMVQTIVKFATVPGLAGPFQHALSMEDIVPEVALVAARPIHV
jgi:hypothetical protein